MKYLCLVYIEETVLNAMPEGEFEAFSDEHVALDEELKKSGHSSAAEALQPVHTATTVRVRNGRLSVTDGPFAETKEQLLAIYLIDAGDLNDAIQVASRIPSARLGSIEVRPVWDLRRGEPRRRADEQDIRRVATTRSRALAHDHVTSGRDRESGAMERAERMRGDRAGN